MPTENKKTKNCSDPYWSAHDLVVIGVFAATARLSTLLIALVGGGMNPVTLLLKNLVFTTLLVVMLYKVRQPGTLLLFVAVNLVFSMLFMGASITLLPAMFIAGIAGEGAALAVGGITARFGPLAAVFVYDLLFRVLSLATSWVVMREAPGMVLAGAAIVAFGYLGAVAGLYTGYKTIRELRHAGIVRF